MAKVRKRILSLVMSLVMVFTLLPVSAFAADECDEKGTNTAGEVISIEGWKRTEENKDKVKTVSLTNWDWDDVKRLSLDITDHNE